MQDVITIVSGLPRSGTSMMMSMLEAGGLTALVDQIRKADEDNPKGYYEFERVKKIKEDDSWLDAAKGKAVKMVSMLLYNLPSDRNYKVIFMRRTMTEILSSQRTMLERTGQGTDVVDEEMGALFTRHLGEIEQWLAAHKNFEVLYVHYNNVIADPVHYAHHINRFMNHSLNEEKMVQAVDRALYRKRSEQGQNDSAAPATASDDAADQEKIEEQLKALGYME